VIIGSLADSLTDKECFSYEDVPHFPVSTVKGHTGQLVFGLLDGVPVMCMQGRFHYYEGYPICKVGLWNRDKFIFEISVERNLCFKPMLIRMCIFVCCVLL
jgi:hypothetical protein